MDFLGVPKQYTRITNQTRRSIVDAIESGASLRDIAETFNVKYSTIRSVNRVWRREGRIEKKKYMLDSMHRDRLLEWLKVNRKRSPDELKQLFTTEFGLKPSKSTIYRALNTLRQDYYSKQGSPTCSPQIVKNSKNQDDTGMTLDYDSSHDSSHEDNFSTTSNVNINGGKKCTELSTGNGYNQLIISHDNTDHYSNQQPHQVYRLQNCEEKNFSILFGPDRCFISTRDLYLHRCLQSDSVLE